MSVKDSVVKLLELEVKGLMVEVDELYEYKDRCATLIEQNERLLLSKDEVVFENIKLKDEIDRLQVDLMHYKKLSER